VTFVPTERTRNCLDGSSLFMAASHCMVLGHACQNVAPRGTTLVPASGSPCRARRAACYLTRMRPRLPENAKRPCPRGINKFAYASAAAPQKARNLCKLMLGKTFTSANAAFPYANPPRGDVSP
jgi:hypothetical protein